MNESSTRYLLLRILAAQPGISSSKCGEVLWQRGKKISRQAVHKELARLRTEGVVLKAGRCYALNPAWLSETASFLDLAWQRSREVLLSGIASGAGPVLFTRKFSSFLEADDFWIILLMTALKGSLSKVILQWHPSLWFLLLGSARENTFHSTIARLKGRLYAICPEPATLLESALYRSWDFPRLTRSWAESPFHHLDRTHLTVIDDIVIHMRLSSKTALMIDSLMRMETNESLPALGAVASVAAPKCSVRMTVRRSPRLAAAHRKAFRTYFGMQREDAP